MKFKNYIEVQSGIKDSANSPGTLDQVLTSTATGVAWVDPSTISAEAATLVVIECKNTSGATITKGTPVYQTGTVGATDVIEIAPADALISAGAQPAIGLLQTTLNDNGFGKVVITGELLNFTTDPIDGVTPTTGDKVFLKSGGGLTLTKPTGAGNGIQSLGLIGKVSSGSAGSITVSSIMRTNDVPNLPTGKIWVGDGNTVVSDTVFLDEPNGRMGINTTTPTKDLEIGTNAAAETEFRMHSDESGKYFNIQSAGNFTSVKTAGSQNFILDSSGTAGYITMVTNASERMRVNYNGNVGIGATVPLAKLHVKDGNTLSSALTNTSALIEGFSQSILQIASHSSGYSQIAFGDQDDGFDGGFIYSNVSRYLSIETANVERMRIDSSGNVGIGTTTPATTGGTAKLTVNVGSGTSSPVSIVNGTTDGVFIRRYGTNGKYQIQTTVGAGNSGSLSLQSYGGNVGIGTTSPDAALEVVGGIKLSDNSPLTWATSNTRIIGQSGYMQFQVGATDKMRITSSGNIGIGTTSPSAKLEVSSTSGWGLFTERGIKDGSTSTYSHSYGAGNAHILGRAMYFENVAVFSTSTADATTKEYRFKNSADKLIIESLVSGGITDSNILVLSGSNVGIGTSSPNQKLEVSGNSLVTGTQFIGDTFTKIQQASGNLLLTNQSLSGAITFLTNSTEQVRITSSGNVGIGTTSPIYKLDANGGVRAGGVITYSKPYSNLTTTGQAVAGLTSSSNGNSTGFTFTCFGHTGGYQKIVYSCRNELGTWKTKKVINEGTNDFDVEASADGSTITFTFKSTSGTKSYTPRVTIEATGHSINSTYA